MEWPYHSRTTVVPQFSLAGQRLDVDVDVMRVARLNRAKLNSNRARRQEGRRPLAAKYPEQCSHVHRDARYKQTCDELWQRSRAEKSCAVLCCAVLC